MLRSIRWRLITSYTNLVLLTIAVGGFFLIPSLADHTREGMQADLTAQAWLAASLTEEVRARDGDLNALAKEAEQIVGARVTVIDQNGNVLADSQEDSRSMVNHRDRPEMATALAGGVGQSTRLSETTAVELLYVAVPVRAGETPAGAVRLSLPLTEVSRRTRTVLLTLGGAGLLGAMAALLVGWHLAGQITRPLESMTAVAERVAGGDLEQRMDMTGADEIVRLGQAFNHMSARLQVKVAELSESKGRLDLIVQNIASGIMLVDSRGRINLLNPAATGMLGVSAEESTGIHNLEVFKDYDLNRQIQATLATGQVQQGEIHLILPEERIVEVQLIPVQGEGSTSVAVLLVLRDVTALHRLARVRAEFVSNVSHEMRTPLTSILGFTETLLDGSLEDPARARRFVGIIDTEAERLSRLLDDLLDLSKIESGKIRLDFRKTNLRKVILETMEKVKPQLEKTGLTMTVDLAETFPLILADGDRLAQVLLNLVDNSIKYTHRGGTIAIRGDWRGEEVCISVADNGVGIPSEDLPRIFERFYRVDKARTRTSGGTGLGLAIVKHLVEAHGGRVEVSSLPGQGSTFRFYLPIGD